MSTGWDNATLKKLKALTGKGLSTAEIGKRLGMSKNAIVGKLNRLGWNPKATAGAAGAKTPKKISPAKKTIVKTPTKKAATSKGTPSAKTQKTQVKSTKKISSGGIVSNSKSLAVHQRIVQHSLEMANMKPNQCRWPIGDPDSEHFHFCGAPVFVGKPYCYEHCKQAYQFTAPKKKQ